ncbi:MAG: TRAP transporter, 4TM/12TM fusion protein, partial [Synergistales bacterium 57_84]
AIAGFIVPFMFAYNQALLFQGSLVNVLLSSVTAILGVIALAAGVQGFYLSRLNMLERVLFVVTAVALIKPGILSDVIGIVVLGGIYLLQRRSLKVKKNKETSGEEI